MNSVTWFSVLAASLMGSLHCAGMCGGMAGFAAGSLNRKRRVGGQVAYNLGRLGAYLGLGAIAGAFGLGLNSASARAGVGGGAALVAGILMIVWALLRLLPLLKPFSNWTPWAASKLGCGFSKALSWASAMPPLLRSVLIGLATGLLPCGWLYAFVLAAVGTGSMLHGVGVLFAFWLGTLPALLGIGSLAQLLSQRFRRLLPALSACLLLSIGLGSLFTRYNSVDRVLSWHPSPPPGLDGTKSTGLTSEDALPPCHRH